MNNTKEALLDFIYKNLIRIKLNDVTIKYSRDICNYKVDHTTLDYRDFATKILDWLDNDVLLKRKFIIRKSEIQISFYPINHNNHRNGYHYVLPITQFKDALHELLLV